MWKLHLSLAGGRRLTQPVVSQGAHLPCSHLSHRPGPILLTYCWKSETYSAKKNMQNNFKLWADLCTRVSSDGVFGTRLEMAGEDLQRCLGRGQQFIFTWLGLACKDAHEEVNSLSQLDLTCLDLQRCSGRGQKLILTQFSCFVTS